MIKTLPLFALVFSLFAATAFAQGPASERTWQFSRTAKQVLSVRDKYGDDGDTYTALFTVRAGNGKVFTATKQISGSAFGSVTFPDDFSNQYDAPSAGNFTWAASVENYTIISGKFSMTVN